MSNSFDLLLISSSSSDVMFESSEEYWVQGSDTLRAADDDDADSEHVRSLSKSLFLVLVLRTLVLLLLTCLEECLSSSFSGVSSVSDWVPSLSVAVSDSLTFSVGCLGFVLLLLPEFSSFLSVLPLLSLLSAVGLPYFFQQSSDLCPILLHHLHVTEDLPLACFFLHTLQKNSWFTCLAAVLSPLAKWSASRPFNLVTMPSKSA